MVRVKVILENFTYQVEELSKFRINISFFWKTNLELWIISLYLPIIEALR